RKLVVRGVSEALAFARFFVPPRGHFTAYIIVLIPTPRKRNIARARLFPPCGTVERVVLGVGRVVDSAPLVLALGHVPARIVAVGEENATPGLVNVPELVALGVVVADQIPSRHRR